MPATVQRNYLPLAKARNRASWGELPRGNKYVTRATVEFEASADRQEAAYLQARRDRLVERIAKVAEHPSLFWNHRYFRNLRVISVADTDDAVREVKNALAYWRNRAPIRRPAGIVSELREAMVFARYFRRFSARVWQRRAA